MTDLSKLTAQELLNRYTAAATRMIFEGDNTQRETMTAVEEEWKRRGIKFGPKPTDGRRKWT